MKIMNKVLLTILSFSSLSLFAADRSAKQFDRETQAKERRAAERERQEVQAIADELNAQQAPDAADVDSDNDVEVNGQADLKDAIAQQESQAEQDLKAAEDILYRLEPVNAKTFSGPGLPKKLQKLVAAYALDSSKNGSQDSSAKEDGQRGWRLFKTIDGLKGPIVVKVLGKFTGNKCEETDPQYYLSKSESRCNIIGKVMVTGESDGTLKLWRINPYECIAQIKLGNPIHSIAINQQERFIAVSFSNKTEIALVEIKEQNQQKFLKLDSILKNNSISKAELAFRQHRNPRKPISNKETRSCMVVGGPEPLMDIKKFMELSIAKGSVPAEFLIAFRTDTSHCQAWKTIGLGLGAKLEPTGLIKGPLVARDIVHHCHVKKYNYNIESPDNSGLLSKPITCLHTFPKNDRAVSFDHLVIAHDDGLVEVLNETTRENEKFASGQRGINGLQAFYTEKQDIAYLLSSADDGTIKIWENSLQDPFKKCGHCKKDKHAQTGIELQWCACKAIKYCSPECQKEDWKNHKTTCTANPKRKESSALPSDKA